MDLDLVAVLVDERADLVDVGGRTRRGVDVHHEAVGPRGLEDLLELRLAVGVVRAAAEQEAGLQRDDARLAGEGESAVR